MLLDFIHIELQKQFFKFQLSVLPERWFWRWLILKTVKMIFEKCHIYLYIFYNLGSQKPFDNDYEKPTFQRIEKRRDVRKWKKISGNLSLFTNLLWRWQSWGERILQMSRDVISKPDAGDSFIYFSSVNNVLELDKEDDWQLWFKYTRCVINLSIGLLWNYF